MEDVLKVIIPAVAVIGVAIFYFDRAVRQMRRQDTPNPKLEREKIMLPLEVQAYERLTLLLERITPSPLVMRVNDQKSNSAQLQLALLRAIRDEFEHNVSMQIYVSDALWAQVVTARDECASVIQTAAQLVDATAPSLRLCQQIFEIESQRGNKAIRMAMASIKAEMKQHLV